MFIFQIIKYAVRKFSKSEWVFNKESLSQPHTLDWDKAKNTPGVSIIVPTRDKLHLLKKCVDSIRETTSYENYELVIVDNDSVEFETLEYLNDLAGQGVKVIQFHGIFNFSKICNFAAATVESDFLCFLNNDAEVAISSWLGDLVTAALPEDVCVAGPVILANATTIQEIGIGFGVSGIAGQIHAGTPIQSAQGRETLKSDHLVSAVSFACALVKREKYWELGGLDENFAVGLNDIDFCYRAAEKGLKNKIVSSSVIFHLGYGSRPTMQSINGAFKAIFEVVHFLRKHKQFEFKDTYLKLSLRSR